MDEKQLKASIEDAVALLRSIDVIVPGKLDTDIITYLEAVHGNDWLLANLKEQLDVLAKQQKPKIQRVG